MRGMQIAKASSKRARRSRAEWAREVRSYRASGQGAAEYAAAHDLNAGTLCAWVSKLGKAETTAPERRERRFVPVRVTRGERARAEERLGEVEVTLRNGWRVRVGEVPREGLVELLELLEGDSRC